VVFRTDCLLVFEELGLINGDCSYMTEAIEHMRLVFGDSFDKRRNPTRFAGSLAEHCLPLGLRSQDIDLSRFLQAKGLRGENVANFGNFLSFMRR
jgi:hypothetical protein